MTVFKGYIKMALKKYRVLLMYFGIFSVISIILSNAYLNDTGKKFEAMKLDVAFVNNSDSELSGIVEKYINKNHNMTVEKDDSKRLYELLYYGKADVVIKIESDFEEKVKNGESAICMTQRPGSYSGMYLKSQLDMLICDMRQYENAGYSLEESYKRFEETKETKVSMLDMNGEGGTAPKYSMFLEFIPYLMTAALGTSLAMILFSFRKEEIRKRMTASSVSLFRQNAEAMLAFVAVGCIVFAIAIVEIIALYGKDFLNSPNLGYYLVNIFLQMLFALGVAFVIGMIAKKDTSISMISVPLSLAMSFLGGVFVPLDVVSKEVRAIANFIPFSWYEKNMDILNLHSDISGTIRNQVWQGMIIQLLFVVVMIAVGLVIAKLKQQEN